MQNNVRPLNNAEAMAALKCLLSGWDFMENLDYIMKTNLYRNGLKQKVNILLPELERFAVQLNPLIDKSEDTTQALLQYKRELIQKVAAMRPDDQSLLNAVLEEFFNAPEETAQRLGVLAVEQIPD